MLVCSVSQLRRRAGIAADLAEAASALDAPGTGNVVFATLVDDPASVGEHVDAFLGEIMREVASAASTVSAGLTYSTAIVEAAFAAELWSGAVPISATVLETAAAGSVESATVTAASTPTTWNPADLSTVTLTNANLTAAGTATPSGVRAIASHNSGKYYWENTYNTIFTNSMAMGLALSTVNLASSSLLGSAIMTRVGAIIINNINSGVTLGTRAVNDKIGIAVDFTAKLIWFRVAPSGNWNNSGTADPATGAGGISTSALSAALFPVFMNTGNTDRITANFGASAFTGSVPSGFTAGFI